MLSSIFSTITFLNPWLLTAIFALPALFFLLRVSPPPANRIVFPAFRFIKDLQPDTHTARHTPWWILLLRILVLALVILAFSEPVKNLQNDIAIKDDKNAVRIIIDNSWASAHNFEDIRDKALEIALLAERQNKAIDLHTTAPMPADGKTISQAPVSASAARGLIKGLSPRPWSSDNTGVIRALRREKQDSFFLSSGLDDQSGTLLNELQKVSGTIHLYVPDDKNSPAVLKPDINMNEVSVSIQSSTAIKNLLPLSLRAEAKNGTVLDTRTLTTLDHNRKSHKFVFQITEDQHHLISQIKVLGRRDAGSVLIFGSTDRRKTVGIYRSQSTDNALSLDDDAYYIQKALLPYAEIITGSVDTLITGGSDVIALPDITVLPPADMQTLQDWIKKDGGLLLRFAGPSMENIKDNSLLLPVPVKTGGRALDGAITWETPSPMAPFPEGSPFYGISITDNILIQRQLLAEPVADIGERTWASLKDGTPIITAAPSGRGMIVLIHTTAGPDWSNLPLTGTYIDILKRVTELSGTSYGDVQSKLTGALKPQLVLDGYGNMQQPTDSVMPLNAIDIQNKNVTISYQHPPGLYGGAGQTYGLYLSDHIGPMKNIKTYAANIDVSGYNANGETAMLPYLLGLAFMLFVVDWLVMTLLHIRNFPKRKRATPALVILCLLSTILIASISSNAAFANDEDITYAQNIHLAFVSSGSPILDSTTRQGLQVLGQALAERTSIEPSGIVALDLERDNLSLFPLIYWPVSESFFPALSSEAITNLQAYIDNGGTILFDTRDQISAPASGIQAGQGHNAVLLREYLGKLNVPPLQPMPKEHVLTKSFYLLDHFPGHYQNGTFWVEQSTKTGRDNVSSIMVGSHDWAAAWAELYRHENSTVRRRMIGRTKNQEHALRFGINLVMYALTGNYKGDQIHLPQIMERLGGEQNAPVEYQEYQDDGPDFDRPDVDNGGLDDE